MSDHQDLFLLLAQAAEADGTPLVLIGGVALNFHGCARETLDIDILIEKKRIQILVQALLKIGYNIRAQSDAFVQLQAPMGGLAEH